MLFWTAEQCETWCNQQGLAIANTGDLSFSDNHVCTAQFAIPHDCGRRCAFSNNLIDIVGFADEVLLWIIAWGIFPSSENSTIFESYRASLGEHRQLLEAPGHLLHVEHDQSIVQTLLYLSLISYWDVWLVDGRRPFVLEFNHDNKCRISSPVADLVDSAAKGLAAFGLEQLR